MLATSKDLLNVIIAFSILWFTVFVCWALWYVISMLRSAAQIATSVRKKMEIVDKILELVKDKLEKGSNHMAVIADSAIKLVGFLIEKQKSGSRKSKKK